MSVTIPDRVLLPLAIIETTDSDTIAQNRLRSLVFLLDNQIDNTGYDYIKYHYGPFSKQLITDCNKLCIDGVLTKTTTRTFSGTKRIEYALADGFDASLDRLDGELVATVRAAAQTLTDRYAGRGHRVILEDIYDEWPKYTNHVYRV